MNDSYQNTIISYLSVDERFGPSKGEAHQKLTTGMLAKK